MELCSRILENEKYKELVTKLETEEKDREFCCHNLEHFLAVARIAHLENCERNLGVNKEHIYAAALLHDIGRCEEFSKADSHGAAGAEVAQEILNECGCDEYTISEITAAIFNHGNMYISNQDNLCGLIYRADKLSRNCFLCKSAKKCNWSVEKRNSKIER